MLHRRQAGMHMASSPSAWGRAPAQTQLHNTMLGHAEAGCQMARPQRVMRPNGKVQRSRAQRNDSPAISLPRGVTSQRTESGPRPKPKSTSCRVTIE